LRRCSFKGRRELEQKHCDNLPCYGCESSTSLQSDGKASLSLTLIKQRNSVGCPDDVNKMTTSYSSAIRISGKVTYHVMVLPSFLIIKFSILAWEYVIPLLDQHIIHSLSVTIPSLVPNGDHEELV